MLLVIFFLLPNRTQVPPVKSLRYPQLLFAQNPRTRQRPHANLLANPPAVYINDSEGAIPQADSVSEGASHDTLVPFADHSMDSNLVPEVPANPIGNNHSDTGWPRHMTPQSKHYAVKYHWFCEHLAPWRIQLVKIATNNQLGDLFTKVLLKILLHICERCSWVGNPILLYREGV
jgi:hypothetical protein